MNKAEENTPPKVSEVDLLRYRGNNVPRFIRLAWTILIIFSIVYLVRYGWPDLKIWIRRLRA